MSQPTINQRLIEQFNALSGVVNSVLQHTLVLRSRVRRLGVPPHAAFEPYNEAEQESVRAWMVMIDGADRSCLQFRIVCNTIKALLDSANDSEVPIESQQEIRAFLLFVERWLFYDPDFFQGDRFRIDRFIDVVGTDDIHPEIEGDQLWAKLAELAAMLRDREPEAADPSIASGGAETKSDESEIDYSAYKTPCGKWLNTQNLKSIFNLQPSKKKATIKTGDRIVSPRRANAHIYAWSWVQRVVENADELLEDYDKKTTPRELRS